MMNLACDVQEVFSPDGLLSRNIEHFVLRSGQVEMATAVARTIENSGVLVVEASTGVGKTFSYLVPALLCGERVMVSTATKALQDQLFSRDLPYLVNILGLPVSTALLKGRASYLCQHRMGLARQDALLTERTAARTLARIEEWAKVTQNGDLAELPGLDERSVLIPLVTSTRENCLGTQCPSFRSCHVNTARRNALAADVVVINHHLFFADLVVRESGVAELLPTVRVAIFDEAHQLNEIGVQFLGKNLTTSQLLDFCRDMLAAGLQFARGLADWQKLVGDCETAARELRLCVGKHPAGTKLRWLAHAPDGVEAQDWAQSMLAVQNALLAACDALETLSEIAPDFVRLHERAASLSLRAQAFAALCEPNFVRWVDVGLQLRLVESPLNIAETVKTRVIASSAESMKSWIFTSATLGDDEKLSWFTQPCGLTEATVLRVGSPFDYASQAALYIPHDFPKPSEVSHPLRVAGAAGFWARRLGGRTMVLTTTLKALRLIGDELRAAFDQSGELDVLVQGAMPKKVLVDRFRQANTSGQRGCILVASASFWEGIDVPGNALQLVIIDKLPFPPPNDPITEARSKALEADGLSSFNHYFLPEAAVALKQGAGRLIRRETDRGVLVICDVRLAAMGYGKRLVRALPPMLRLQTEAALMDLLDVLVHQNLYQGVSTDLKPLVTNSLLG